MARHNSFVDPNEPTSPDGGFEALGLAPWASASPPSAPLAASPPPPARPPSGSWSIASDAGPAQAAPAQAAPAQAAPPQASSWSSAPPVTGHTAKPQPLTRRQLREQGTAEATRPRGGNARPAPARAKKPRPTKSAARGTARPSPPRALAHPSTRPSSYPSSHPSKKSLRQRVASRLFSLAALVFSAALMLGMTVPAMAINQQGEDVPQADAPKTEIEGQTLAAVQLSEEQTALQRDEWTVTSYAELMRLKYGNRNYSYNVNWTGPVRWPFPFAVPISSGFGDRGVPCRGCSAFHGGLDLTPGAGQPIYAIADGVVSSYSEGWSFGNHVFIDHIIDGRKVTSMYAHMESGSSPLVAGEQVLVGDYVGKVGSTGSSSGAHLHLEIRLDGVVAVDPFTWLNAHTTR